MKKYFEYEFNNKIRNKLLEYYEDPNLNQQEYNSNSKSKLKLSRIKDLVSFSKNDIVLDVGCFKGHILSSISCVINRGVGIDISKNIISLNKQSNSQKNITYSAFDGENINFKKKFNKILALDVLEHSFNPDDLLNSISRSLETEGELILEVPYTGWLSELFAGKYHAGHLRYYDPVYLSNYLEKRGLKIKKIKLYNSVPLGSFFLKYQIMFNMLNSLVNLITPKLYPYFGEILVICKKNER
jgi:SAM-dependent methyltransferase